MIGDMHTCLCLVVCSNTAQHNTTRTHVLCCAVSCCVPFRVVLYPVSCHVVLCCVVLAFGRAKFGECEVFSHEFARRWLAQQLFASSVAGLEHTIYGRLQAQLHGAKVELHQTSTPTDNP